MCGKIVRVSIVTVCYNSEKTIERTFKSVLNQTYGHIEYIVIDGRSNDRTVDIIKEYESKFLEVGYRYIYLSEKDEGMYDAMNKGIKMASGKLIGILNSDDWYEKNTIEKVVNNYRANISGDIFMGAIRVLNGKQEIIKYAKDRKYKTSRNFNHPAMFVTKECYQEVGNYAIENIHSDYGWYLRAIKMGKKVVIIYDVLSNYPTGGLGSKKKWSSSCGRIITKYHVYKENGYSKLYFFECMIQEILKYLFLKNG